MLRSDPSQPAPRRPNPRPAEARDPHARGSDALPPAVQKAAEARAGEPREPGGMRPPETVRIRLENLDELIRLMGEVVSGHAGLGLRIAELDGLRRGIVDQDTDEAGRLEALREELGRFSRRLREDVRTQEVLMGELHGKALVMRMLPLSLVFDPLARMVREIARSLAKDAECIVTGAEIELDRQIIEKLGDPVSTFFATRSTTASSRPRRGGRRASPPEAGYA